MGKLAKRKEDALSCENLPGSDFSTLKERTHDTIESEIHASQFHWIGEADLSFHIIEEVHLWQNRR